MSEDIGKNPLGQLLLNLGQRIWKMLRTLWSWSLIKIGIYKHLWNLVVTLVKAFSPWVPWAFGIVLNVNWPFYFIIFLNIIYLLIFFSSEFSRWIYLWQLWTVQPTAVGSLFVCSFLKTFLIFPQNFSTLTLQFLCKKICRKSQTPTRANVVQTYHLTVTKCFSWPAQ